MAGIKGLCEGPAGTQGEEVTRDYQIKRALYVYQVLFWNASLCPPKTYSAKPLPNFKTSSLRPSLITKIEISSLEGTKSTFHTFNELICLFKAEFLFFSITFYMALGYTLQRKFLIKEEPPRLHGLLAPNNNHQNTCKQLQCAIKHHVKSITLLNFIK